MGNRLDWVDLRRKLDFGDLWVHVVLLCGKSIGPPFRENGVDTTLLHRLHNGASHGFGIRNNDASETDVYNLLSELVGRIDEGHQVRGWGPFLLRTVVRIVQEPVS